MKYASELMQAPPKQQGWDQEEELIGCHELLLIQLIRCCDALVERFKLEPLGKRGSHCE